MSQIEVRGDQVVIDGQVLYGLRFVGRCWDASEVLLAMNGHVAARLAVQTTAPLSTFFSAMANWLPRSQQEPTKTEHHEQYPSRTPTRFPKKDCPYLRYTDAQLKAAWSVAPFMSHYSTYGPGYARLYLIRDSLVMMYQRPRHLRLIYATLLKILDKQAEGIATQLMYWGAVVRCGDESTSRTKPYEQFTTEQMSRALTHLGIALPKRLAYGQMSLSLPRATLLKLYRGGPEVKPAMARLIQRIDELHA